ncbi:transcription termination/antitermination NusG family protein [Aurantimonas sp. A2-1-M11]|uniref:transcription termination/antitermination protein NusG n=1 Tax=Aurantimonas sp. A2-1-M11 TaxID=3113712 RepID=UPI002F94FFAE
MEGRNLRYAEQKSLFRGSSACSAGRKTKGAEQAELRRNYLERSAQTMAYSYAELGGTTAELDPGTSGRGTPFRGDPARPAEQTGRQETSWFIVQTNPQCDERAMQAIERMGFVAMSLTWRQDVWRRRSRQWVRTIRRLFPRYLFVGFDERHPPFGAVRRCDGVERFLGVDGKPQPVGSATVANLVELMGRGLFDDLRPAEPVPAGELPVFEIGDEVVVKDDRLLGELGVVVKRHGRRSVSVKLHGQRVEGVALRPVRIRVDKLQRAR